MSHLTGTVDDRACGCPANQLHIFAKYSGKVNKNGPQHVHEDEGKHLFQKESESFRFHSTSSHRAAISQMPLDVPPPPPPLRGRLPAGQMRIDMEQGCVPADTAATTLCTPLET